MAVAQPLRIGIEIMGTCQSCKYMDRLNDTPFCLRVLHITENQLRGTDTFPLIVTISKKEVDSFLAVPLDFGCNQWVKDEPVILPDYQE